MLQATATNCPCNVRNIDEFNLLRETHFTSRSGIFPIWMLSDTLPLHVTEVKNTTSSWRLMVAENPVRFISSTTFLCSSRSHDEFAFLHAVAILTSLGTRFPRDLLTMDNDRASCICSERYIYIPALTLDYPEFSFATSWFLHLCLVSATHCI